ncbi:MAG TPA: translocation/assembly module TamB domain-containing protein, partial [Vicinamibacterales bacterium]|nr:translocation/assembly module TamB domain-containing protein [Vicinamibacterales bacterium]
ERAAADARRGGEWGPFAVTPLPEHVPMAGTLTYRYGPTDVTLESGRFSTEATDVTFGGATVWGGDRSRIGFHVVSADWQEADQLLAGIITDFGSPTHAVSFGGRGEFDGTMTGAFRSPRVEGRFSGDDLRAWDTPWGSGTCTLVVENSYVTITDGVVKRGDSEIDANGKFSLGYPRDDGGEEIDARFKAVRRDLDSLRHAFKIDDYPVSGAFSGDFHLTGEYERPVGFGGMQIDDGAAYGEPFQKATASVRFDGTGARLDEIRIAKGAGAVTGAAYIGWDSTYSFSAEGRQLPVGDLAFLAFPKVPLGGGAEFTANGRGTFDVPSNDIKATIRDMRIGDEAVGTVTGTLQMRGKDLSGDLNASSPRFTVTGQGRVQLTPRGEAEITLRVHDSSLDPYVRLFLSNLSTDTTATVTGLIHAKGQLADVDTITAEATVDTLDLRLLDFSVHNPSPIRLTLAKQRIAIDDLQIAGENTELRLSGSVGLRDRQIAIKATGAADLGILQGVFPRRVRGDGRAELRAAIDGALDQPRFSGTATITNGRIRHSSMPNALDAINGTIQFDPDGIRLDALSATMGGGRIQFGGRIVFDGFVPSQLHVTARGTDMHLRYPEDIRSVIDADLDVEGPVQSPELRGEVTVKSATWNRRVNVPSITDLAARRAAAIESGPSVEAAPTAVPLRFNLHIAVPSTLRIDNNLARMVANADLSLRGTYDRPVMLGHAEVERGEVIFQGRRYAIRRGAIDFTNPNKIEPFFDVEAETNVRQFSQNYRITVTAAGTTDRLSPTFDSDPPLPTADVIALLLSEAQSSTQTDAELRALQNPNERQTNILTAQGTQYMLGTQKVGDVVQQTFGVDTFQLSPILVDPYAQTTRVNPTARVTIGKRISDRAYLTFSRSLGTTQNDQIVLLEYEASDRLSWILSRNEDLQTFTLEFRVRHTF